LDTRRVWGNDIRREVAVNQYDDADFIIFNATQPLLSLLKGISPVWYDEGKENGKQLRPVTVLFRLSNSF
jgi:hypothetical protein